MSDLPASVAFYRDVVGLDHKFTDAGYAEFATGEVRFALYERRRAAWLTGGDPVLGPTDEAVFVVDDVDSQAIRLTNLGIDVLSGPVDRPWGHRTLHIADPDGFIVEFAQPIPRTRFRKDETQAAVNQWNNFHPLF